MKPKKGAKNRLDCIRRVPSREAWVIALALADKRGFKKRRVNA